jgi:hypothetical protein
MDGLNLERFIQMDESLPLLNAAIGEVQIATRPNVTRRASCVAGKLGRDSHPLSKILVKSRPVLYCQNIM